MLHKRTFITVNVNGKILAELSSFYIKTENRLAVFHFVIMSRAIAMNRVALQRDGLTEGNPLQVGTVLREKRCNSTAELEIVYDNLNF